MNTTTNTTDRLFINQNGMCECELHGGYSLKCSVQANPTAFTHTTDLDHWTTITPINATRLLGSWIPACETCGATIAH